MTVKKMTTTKKKRKKVCYFFNASLFILENLRKVKVLIKVPVETTVQVWKMIITMMCSPFKTGMQVTITLYPFVWQQLWRL